MDKNKKLEHVAIILDGNGRWAKQRGLERVSGHMAGAENVVNFVKSIRKYPEIKYITLYAFSTENWKRSQEEVDALMELLCEFLDNNLSTMLDQKIRLRMTGDISGLPEKCRTRLEKVMAKTADQAYERTFILAINYGGRQEIARAFRRIAAEMAEGKVDASAIDEQMISEHLDLPDVPDPDLMIRTSGEERISNFLLWQLSYSEFYFTDVLWPDFDIVEFDKAVDTYYHRNRRYGGR